MEYSNGQISVTPEIINIAGALTIDYVINSISIENEGEADGLINGQTIKAGKIFNFSARQGQVYRANVFVLDATGTSFQILINK